MVGAMVAAMAAAVALVLAVTVAAALAVALAVGVAVAVAVPVPGRWGYHWRAGSVHSIVLLTVVSLLGSTPDPCEAAGHKMETVHSSGPIVHARSWLWLLLGGCCARLAPEHNKEKGQLYMSGGDPATWKCGPDPI